MIIENKIPNQNSLERFISAQNTCYEQVVFELGQGKKTSHWIWYVFPQLAGLGFSEYSVYYGIKGLSEAKAYWAHPVLRERYEECLHLVLGANKLVEQVFGKTDAQKLQSSITLFLEVEPESPLLNDALEQLYFGERDMRTVGLLEQF